MKEKYTQRILRLFENERSARLQESQLKSKYNHKKILESRQNENTKAYLKKKELLNTKHKERLKSLYIQRQLQEESIVERLNRSSLSPRKVKTVLKKEKPVFILTNDEKEIEQKLQKFNRKLLKSSENYAKNLNEKIENLKSLSRRRATLDDSDEYDQKVMMLSCRLSDAFSRRNKLQMKLKEKFQEKETRATQRGKVRKENEKEANSDEEVVNDEKKLNQIFVHVKNRKTSLGDCRSEKMKKLEASINEKIKNIKKEEFLKKEKILEKHQKIEKKQKEHKDLLEIKNKNIRDKAMSFTIEKEKTSNIPYLVAKSQNPEEIQKLMEKFKMQI